MSCAEEERVKDTAGPLRYSSEGEKDRRQNKHVTSKPLKKQTNPL